MHRLSLPALRPTACLVSVVGLVALVTLSGVGHSVFAADAAPNLERALAAQYEMAAERPYDATVQNDLGNLLVLAERPAQAEEAYRRALEIDGTHIAARFNLALLLQHGGDDSAAIDQLATLLELQPSHAWAHYQKGVSHEREGQRRAAIRHYARAFHLDPGLTFAENNPHIIDNELATEALLVSGREAGNEVRRVPRQYDEADRIAELMLAPAVDDEAPDAEPTADGSEARENETAGEAVDVQGTGPSSGTPVERAPAASGASRPTKDAGTSDATTGPDDEESAGVDQSEGARTNRVITSEDLDSGRSGGVSRRGAAAQRPDLRSRPSDGRPVAPRPRGANPSVDRQSQERPQAGSQTNPRYRPSRRSSASLELRLLPENDSLPDPVSAG